MERAPRNTEQITAEVTDTDNGIDVTVGRRRDWHFASREEARVYFRRKHLQFSSLQWAMRALVIAGAVDVAHGVDQTIRNHDFFTGAGAIAVSGLILIVQGLNQRAVGERVRLHNEVIRRFRERVDE